MSKNYSSNLCICVSLIFHLSLIHHIFIELEFRIQHIIFVKCFDLRNMKRDTEWKTNLCRMYNDLRFCCSFSGPSGFGLNLYH